MTRTFAIIIAIALASPVLAQPLPVPKSGTCPAGYRESGGYCSPPSPRSPEAIRSAARTKKHCGLTGHKRMLRSPRS
jgi:hypothetical protein